MSGVLVSIPVHNNLESVKQCIETVVESCVFAEVDYTLVVVDDHSDAETIGGLISLNNQYAANMILLHTKLKSDNPAPNLSMAVNMALDAFQHSTCDYFWNVESDVYPEPSCLIELITALERHPDAGMVCPLFIDPAKKQIRHAYPGSEGQALAGQLIEKAPQRNLQVTWQHLGCNLVPGEIAKDPRCRLDESFKLWCCDFDWAWCIEDVFHRKLLYVGKAQAVHLGNLSSASADHSNEHAENVRVRQKWNRMHL